MLADLTLQAFTPHLDSLFRVQAGDWEEAMTLVEASAMKDFAPQAPRRPFCLVFRGARTDVMLDQQTMRLDHPMLGELWIMLTPIGRFGDGTFRYQAVFN